MSKSLQEQKLFYRIREVSRITGVKPHVLRYWESEFPMLRPEKGPNDRRRYRQSDIELILRIKKLLYEDKFTVEGARRRLSAADGDGSAKKRKKATESSKTGRFPASAPRPRGTEQIVRRLGRLRREILELRGILTG